MYHLKVNEKYDFDIDKSDGKLLINNIGIDADVQQLDQLNYHIIHNLRSLSAEVISFNKEDKTAEIKIDGIIYFIKAKDQFDILLDKMGLSNLNSAKVSELKAPMPGLVLKVLAKEGDTINKGENLLILEAMKMENIIKSPADVVVKMVKIKPGDKVEKGQVLLQFN